LCLLFLGMYRIVSSVCAQDDVCQLTIISLRSTSLATTIKHSGLAVKKMIDCGAGVVDADYRGNVGVVLFNFGSEDFHVEVGDRIAQLILEQISMVPAVQVEELTETERGAGGFGSTGVSGEPEKKIARTISPTEGQSN
jgi:deoxyuridine 5'-triphosphate nucleotidohydrolase